MDKFYIYILTNKNNTVLYTGCTDDLQRRIYEHKTKELKGFTNKYNVNKLIYYEEYDNADEAFRREHLIKRWKRTWKEELINKYNPNYQDLSENWY